MKEKIILFLARRFFVDSSRIEQWRYPFFDSSFFLFCYVHAKKSRKKGRKKEKKDDTKKNKEWWEKSRDRERGREREREKRKNRTFSLRNKPRSWQVRSSLHFSASFIGVKRREKTRMEEIEWLHRGRLCYRNVSIFSIHIHRPPLHFYDLSAPGA